jgi:hypothetical protein
MTIEIGPNLRDVLDGAVLPLLAFIVGALVLLAAARQSRKKPAVDARDPVALARLLVDHNNELSAENAGLRGRLDELERSHAAQAGEHAPPRPR